MRSLGAERSVELFAPAGWTDCTAAMPFEAAYPGLRPIGSWWLDPNGGLHGLDATGSGWSDRTTGEGVDLSGRHWVLAYGSNADPAKLASKVGFFGGHSVFAVRAAVLGWAAAWCAARRSADRSVVATLVPAPGRVEVHPVLGLTAHQLEAMDRWEGHPDCYRRVRHEGPVLLEPDRPADDVHVYLGTRRRRPALMVAGRYVLCAEVPYQDADRLVAPGR